MVLANLHHIFSSDITITRKDSEKLQKISLSILIKGTSIVGLYIGGLWSSECERFLSKLIPLEHQVRTNSSSSLQIIFVSCDKTHQDFTQHLAVMPEGWAAIPYEERVYRRQILEHLKVNSLPAFILFDAATGELLTSAGTHGIAIDPLGRRFPWTGLSIPWYRQRFASLFLRQVPFFIIILFGWCCKRNSNGTRFA